MENRKRVLALLLSLALIVSLCACRPGEQADGGESPGPGAEPSIEVDLTQDAVAFSTGLSGDDVLLTVNGEGIPANLFLYWLFWDCSYYEYYYGITADNYADMMLEDTVSSALYYTVLRQKAAELGCLLTDEQQAEVDARMTVDPEAIEERKALYGVTDETIEYEYSINYYRYNLLDAIAPTATDEMLNNYVYQARHILLKTVERVLQDDGTYAYVALPAETVAEKKRLAEDILARIRAADDPIAEFDELMNEFSEDGRDENGELYSPEGYIAVLGDMVPGFEQGALALEPGEISGLVESSYGYHIILRGEVADIESYADECREYYLDKELNALMETAEVTRASALETLDVAAFYKRCVAYQAAVMERDQAGDAVG